MGRATRWLKGLFGMKNSKENAGNEDYSGERISNARRDAVGICNNPATIPPNITPAEAAWLRSFFSDNDKEHSKHAIAVAAATAAAADAAVAAAQAAVAVVRLTSQQGRGGHANTANAPSLGGARDKYFSALKIQAVFRGYLARKALRALKGLVKIQALVRGYLVRKQAAATLYSMQALIRAQASVRARRNRSFITDENVDLHFSTEMKEEDFRSSHEESQQHSHSSRRLSSSLEPGPGPFDLEAPKIVEVDTGSKAHTSKSRRTTSWATNPDPMSIAEPLTAPIPHQINTASGHNPARLLNPDNNWDEHYYHVSATTQSTPRFAANCGCEEHGFITTPSRSACLDGYGGSNFGADKAAAAGAFHPNYMAKTASFKAKLRSQSAPRQRPGEGGLLSSRRRLSLHEMMESRNSLRVERSSCSQPKVREAVTFKNAVMGKINGRF